MLKLVLILFLFCTLGCGGQLNGINSSTQIGNISNSCTCPTLTDGSVCGSNGVSYASSCLAQCDGVEVVSEGSCGYESCNPNSGKVCGSPPYVCDNPGDCDPPVKTYMSDCQRVTAKATFVNVGECN